MSIRPVHMAFGLAVALALSACDSQPAPTEAAPAAPTYPATRAGAFEAASGTPEEMVRALYAAYAAHEPLPAPGSDPLYSRTLNALVGEDFRRSNGKPWLKNDPVCDCSDGTVALTSISVNQADRTNAAADVVFTLNGVEKRQTLTLIREATRWRIADIKRTDNPSLSESLFKAVG